MTEEAHKRIEQIEGEVKWFDPRKGFGFIVGPEGQDIFVHYTVIEGDGFRALKDGSRVNYDAERSEKGWTVQEFSGYGADIEVLRDVLGGLARAPAPGPGHPARRAVPRCRRRSRRIPGPSSPYRCARAWR